MVIVEIVDLGDGWSTTGYLVDFRCKSIIILKNMQIKRQKNVLMIHLKCVFETFDKNTP